MRDSIAPNIPSYIQRKQALLYICVVTTCWVVGHLGYSIAWCLYVNGHAWAPAITLMTQFSYRWIVPFLFYWSKSMVESHVVNRVDELEEDRVEHPDFETAEWVNQVISQLWYIYPRSLSAVITGVLEPVLKNSKPFIVVCGRERNHSITIHSLHSARCTYPRNDVGRSPSSRTTGEILLSANPS